MPSFERHFGIMQEKKEDVYRAYKEGKFSVVGDLAIKIVEQALEADAFRSLKRHLGGHDERISYATRHLSREIGMRVSELFRIYGRLGYDGEDGIRAKRAVALVNEILEFMERKWGEKIGIEHPERP